MKPTHRKLQLDRTTVRVLTAPSLSTVHGGAAVDSECGTCGCPTQSCFCPTVICPSTPIEVK